jgi:hypothetical protein
MRNKVAPPLALKRGGYSLGVIRRDRNDVGAGLTWPRMIVTPQSGTFNNNNNTTPVTHTLELTNFTLFFPPIPPRLFFFPLLTSDTPHTHLKGKLMKLKIYKIY